MLNLGNACGALGDVAAMREWLEVRHDRVIEGAGSLEQPAEEPMREAHEVRDNDRKGSDAFFSLTDG